MRKTYNKIMQETKDSDIKIVPIGQLYEERREEVLMRLERVEYEIEELKTFQVKD